jgi:peptidoglycan/LPS O-acetylase OafA/YrhL
MSSLRDEKSIKTVDPSTQLSHQSEAAALVGERDVTSGSVHLDALRGLAALLVFSGHTRALYFTSAVPNSGSTAPAAPSVLALSKTHAAPATTEPSQVQAAAEINASLMNSGEIRFASEAVILFFVLSGYLVGGSVLRLMKTARWSWRTYLTKRLTRLYVVLIPALLIGGSLDYIGSRIFGPGSVYTSPYGIQLITTYQLAERFHPSVFFGDLLFLDSFKVPYFGTNVALWSLSNEFWYYMIFPMLCLAIVWGGKPLWRVFWLVMAVALMVFTGLNMTVLFPLWIFGALISIIPRIFTAASAKWLGALNAALLLIVMLGVRLLHWASLPADYLIALVTGTLLYFLAQLTSRAKPGLYKVLASFFSRISYTLYLFHVPLAIFLCALINSPWHQWQKTPARLAMFALSDTVLVVCAYLLWRLFEARTDQVRSFLFREEEKPRRSNP